MKTRISLYLDEPTRKLLDDMYTKAILDGEKLPYSRIVSLALQCYDACQKRNACKRLDELERVVTHGWIDRDEK